jgi:hypothetical protein
MKIIRVMFSMIAAVTVAIVGARLSGGVAQPLGFFASTFLTNPDGSLCAEPCLFGIRPDITNYADIPAIIAAHPVARYIPQPNVQIRSSWTGNGFTFMALKDISPKLGDQATSLYVFFVTQQRLAKDIVDNYPRLSLTVGQVITFLGAPLAIDAFADNAWLYYPNSRMIIEIKVVSRDVNHLDASDPDPVISIFVPVKQSYRLPLRRAR